MKIKSFEELKNLKSSYSEEMGIRAGVSLPNSKPEITVGIATCAVAAGADETLEAIKDEIKKLALDVKVVTVGCIGFCHYEPIVQVNIPGMKSTFYGKVNANIARKIIQKHIVENEYLDGYIIDLPFEKA